MKIFVTLLVLLMIPKLTAAQEDKDVKENEVPGTVKEYLMNNFKGASPLKYYKEIKGDTIFYEAYFKFKGDQYSLLFFPDGRLFETEIEMKYEELDSEIRDNISKDLNARYSKHKVRKVEIVNPGDDMKYEISIHGKREHHTGYYEIFYDKNGNFLSEEEETLHSMPSNSGF